MRPRRAALAFALLAACACLAPGARAAPPVAKDALVREVGTLSVTIDGSSHALESLIVRPPGDGPFPLAVIAHGAPRDVAQRGRFAVSSLGPQADEMARRGWAVAVVLRRGYGTSTGNVAEGAGPCGRPNYVAAGREGAKDLRAIVESLRAQPFVDASRILIVGVSAGGFAALATAADPPDGLRAVISFAGGRGSPSPGVVCEDYALVRAFGAFGETARVPTLWVYAENDSYFSPGLAHRFHDAFTAGGGQAELIVVGPFGDDGHTLFSRRGTAIWRPLVDDFLRKAGLPTWDAPPADGSQAELTPPRELASDAGRKAWRDFLGGAPSKAFAVGPGGAWGWRAGRNSLDDARQQALENCQRGGARCRIAAEDDELVTP
ncbi:MAG: alpha/beta hydrolase family protein [Alphaproteobacteria bacterium]